MSDDAAEIDRLRMTLVLVRAACRAETSLRFDALSPPSFRAIARGMVELHDASFQTVMLRAGLQLGIIRPAGNA